MAAPQWITEDPNTWITKELEPFSIDLRVQAGISRVTFQLVAGALPPGIRLTPQGNISGYPLGRVTGIPLAVNEETVFEFVIRCQNEIGEIAERNFAITVTGEDPPQAFPAPYINQSLGTFPVGSWVEVNLSGIDLDPNDILSYSVVAGALPPGLTVNPLSGVVSGYLDPSELVLSSDRWDAGNWDIVGWDQGTAIASKTYYFSLKLDDGKIPTVANYNITILAQDTTLPVTDPPKRRPVLLDRTTNLGIIQDENYYGYQFLAKDFDEDTVGFELLPITRTPTVIGQVVNPVITPNSIFSINATEIYNTLGTTSKFYSLPVVPQLSQSIGIYLDSVLQTPEVDYVLSGNQLLFLKDVDTQVISAVQGLIRVTVTDLNSLVQYINTVASQDSVVANVQALSQNNRLLLFTTDATITLAQVLGNTLTQLGIVATTYTRATTDVNLVPSQNPTQLLPNQLQFNKSTGWIQGYVTPIESSEQVYSFFVRVYKLSTESSAVVRSVDYVVEYPFTLINNVTQTQLDQLALDNVNTNFQNKTVVFKQQSNFNSNYVGIFGSVYQTDPSTIDVDGWYNTANTVVPGIGQPGFNSATTVNQRSGVWKFTRYVDRIVAANAVAAQANVTLTSVDTLIPGMVVQGSGINTNTLISSINSINKTVTLSSNVAATVYANSTLTFESENLLLDFQEPLAHNSLIVADTYTPVTGNVWRQHSVKFRYQGIAEAVVPEFTQANVANPYSTLWPKLLTVYNSVNQTVEWQSPSNLGDISIGVPSTLQVIATAPDTEAIRYELVSQHIKTVFGDFINAKVIVLRDTDNLVEGLQVKTYPENTLNPTPIIIKVNNNTIELSEPITVSSNTELAFVGTPLSRGLSLTSSGAIVGRPSFQIWHLDDNTTFDQTTTTFDRTCIINVRASFDVTTDALTREISKVGSFKFRLRDYRDIPASNLYLDFLLENADRTLLRSVVYADNIVQDEDVYRLDDPWFGRRSRYQLLMAYGVNTQPDEIIESITAEYHHLTKFTFTSLQWAQAVNAKGEVEYEVIYIKPQDEFTTANGDTVIGAVFDGTELKPASIVNMRERIKQLLGDSNRNFLPLWMKSPQPNGEILNFVPAIPLVYLKPGTGKRTLFKMQQVLNPVIIQALVDRYTWDDALALNWDYTTQKFIANPLTTFDQFLHNDLEYTIVDSVDLATTQPFYKINNQRISTIKSQGLLDGYIGDLNGKTLIFQKQENFGVLSDYQNIQGWAQTQPRYNEDFGDSYEGYRFVPGWNDIQLMLPGEWLPGPYQDGDFVQHEGVVYRCVTAHNSNKFWALPEMWRRKITIDHTQLFGALTDFPVLVRIQSSLLRSKNFGGEVFSSVGNDIVFSSDADGVNLLKWDLEHYDPVNGIVIAWVKIPTIPAIIDTAFWMFYGNSDITTYQGDAVNVWDSDYQAVYHGVLIGNTSPDSTGVTGSLTTNQVTNSIGEINQSLLFNGTTSNASTAITTLTTATLETWVKVLALPASGDNGAAILGLYNTDTDGATEWASVLGINSDGKFVAYAFDGAVKKVLSNTTIQLDTWYHLALTQDNNSVLTLYVNGNPEITTTLNTLFNSWSSGPYLVSSVTTTSDPEAFGSYFSGVIGEIKISDTVRPSEWLSAEYVNQNHNSNLLALTSPQRVSFGLPQANAASNYFVPLTSTTQVQKSGIWQITETPEGTVQLVFKKEIPYSGDYPWSAVFVRSGFLWGQRTLALVPPTFLPAPATTPGFLDKSTNQLTVVTVFDQNNTKFFDKNTDSYTEFDQGAKYSVFTKTSLN